MWDVEGDVDVDVEVEVDVDADVDVDGVLVSMPKAVQMRIRMSN